MPTCCPAISSSDNDSAERVDGLPARPCDHATSGPAAINRTRHCCGCHFGEGGAAAPVAVGRHQPAANRQQIFAGTRSPARDFTTWSLPGFDPNLPGNELDYDPGSAALRRPMRSHRGAAGKGSLTAGRWPSWDCDVGQQHQERAIDAVVAPQPTFAGFLAPRSPIAPSTVHFALDGGRLPVDDRVSLRCSPPAPIQRRRLHQPGIRVALAAAEAAHR